MFEIGFLFMKKKKIFTIQNFVILSNNFLIKLKYLFVNFCEQNN